MNVFLVTSPFQYICAIEARTQYKINSQESILLLVNQKSSIGLAQQKLIINERDWGNIVKIERSNRSIAVPKSIRSIKRILDGKAVDNFFHAEYTGWRTKLILRNLNIRTEIYYDDGTLTINEYEESIREAQIYHRPRLLQDILVRLNGCKAIGKLKQSDHLELFTVFDIPSPNHKIVKNTLSELKQRYGSRSLYKEDAPIGFIGQGAIGHKHQKSVESYLKELNYFISKNNKDIIYFPHRTESPELREIISNISQIDYHMSELPLEIELIDKNILLSGLVGFCSTAQYTTRVLNPDMPIYNLLPKEESLSHMSPKNITRQKRILELFERVNIESISVD